MQQPTEKPLKIFSKKSTSNAPGGGGGQGGGVVGEASLPQGMFLVVLNHLRSVRF